jgi:hypothetical protein
MEWLPGVLVFVMGLLLLVLLLVWLLGHLRRALAATRTMGVAVTGRTVRIRAGLAEIRLWREAHRRYADDA